MKNPKQFIKDNEHKMQPVKANFMHRQIALFRMLAKDWNVDWQDVPAILIEKQFQRIQELEDTRRAQTLN